MMSLNLASHSKARGQTQSDARKGFISLKKKEKKNNLTGMWGEGSKLNITVACSLVADKNQVIFSEKHV